MSPALPTTREQWLLQAADYLRNHLFQPAGAVVPTVRISVGFPAGRSVRTTLGQYICPEICSDGTAQIFISPVEDDPIEALAVLGHELVHACVPKAGHGPAFKRLALKIGLTGPMPSTVAGVELHARLVTLAQHLGPFPHAKIIWPERKKAGTRLGKVFCRTCGYTARTTRMWIERSGAPLCPCNREPMEFTNKENAL